VIFERGNIRSQCLENSFQKILWNCRKTGYVMVMMMVTNVVMMIIIAIAYVLEICWAYFSFRPQYF